MPRASGPQREALQGTPPKAHQPAEAPGAQLPDLQPGSPLLPPALALCTAGAGLGPFPKDARKSPGALVMGKGQPPAGQDSPVTSTWVPLDFHACQQLDRDLPAIHPLSFQISQQGRGV